MTATVSSGPNARELTRDKDGHRNYSVTHQVITTTSEDGPHTIMNAPGLPVIGSTWSFGNDNDTWAQCWPQMRVVRDPKADRFAPRAWLVTQNFTTKPFSRCQTTPVGNPVLEPMEIGGSFVRGKITPAFDKDGDAIVSSSHQPIPVEFDKSEPAVVIKQNVLILGLASFSAQINTVNSVAMWGLGTRRIKLSDVPWSRKVYGSCNFYYTLEFHFDVNTNTFDRTVQDVGTMFVKPGGNKNNLDDFIRAKDDNDENLPSVALDGNGNRATTAAGAALITVQHYPESNLLLLGNGIPAIIG